jgi:hypothetical protein
MKDGFYAKTIFKPKINPSIPKVKFDFKEGLHSLAPITRASEQEIFNASEVCYSEP